MKIEKHKPKIYVDKRVIPLINELKNIKYVPPKPNHKFIKSEVAPNKDHSSKEETDDNR